MNSVFYGCRVAEVSGAFLNLEMNLFVLFFKSFLLEMYSDLQVVLIRAAKGEDAGEKISASKSDPWVSEKVRLLTIIPKWLG